MISMIPKDQKLYTVKQLFFRCYLFSRFCLWGHFRGDVFFADFKTRKNNFREVDNKRLGENLA